MAMIFAFDAFLFLKAKFFKNLISFSTNIILSLYLPLLFEEIIYLAPFCKAFEIYSNPCLFFPLIVKKILFFFIVLVSIEIP